MGEHSRLLLKLLLMVILRLKIVLEIWLGLTVNGLGMYWYLWLLLKHNPWLRIVVTRVLLVLLLLLNISILEWILIGEHII